MPASLTVIILLNYSPFTKMVCSLVCVRVCVCLCVRAPISVPSTMHDPEHFPSFIIIATRGPERVVLNTISSLFLLSFSSRGIYVAE